jgi:macrolide-specific efflux system membrane fusion protein
MKRKYLIIGGLALAAVIVIGWVVFANKPTQKSKAGYKTAKVLKRDLSATVQATGTVKAVVGAEVKVGARTPGKVIDLPITVGDKVEQGQILAKIEQDDLTARVKLQEAIVAETRAEESRLVKDLERDRLLRQTNSIPEQKMDQTEALHAIAKARRLKAEAELDVANTLLSYATITAPISGTVAAVSTIQGETVITGLNSPTFVKIIDLDRLEVLAYVDENDIGRVRVDQDAIFTVSAHPSTEFKGKVTAIYPSGTIQDNVVYYITSVSVDNSEGKLMPDMTANVLIFLDQRKGVLTVPNRAVQREGNRKFVMALSKGSPEKRYVEVGWKDQAHTEILEGVREGDLVIIGSGSQK